MGASAVEPQPVGSTLSLHQENDMLSYLGGNKDRHYSQGAKVTFFAGETEWRGAANWWNSALPAIAFDGSNALTRVGLALGQSIYTPDDITLFNPDPLDHPYAGWLYLGALFQRRSATGIGVPVMEHFEINLGIVGPPALGKPAQIFVHRDITDSPRPRGWEYQLEAEPGLLLKYDRAWRLAPTGEAGQHVELIPHVGVNLGNIKTSGEAGLMLRAGWNLPDDFGVTRIVSTKGMTGGLAPSSPRFGVYGFAAVDGELVGQDIFLDGNTVHDSRSVKREPFVANLSWGVAARLWRHFELSWTRVAQTERFVSQQGRHYYGSLTVRALFDY